MYYSIPVQFIFGEYYCGEQIFYARRFKFFHKIFRSVFSYNFSIHQYSNLVLVKAWLECRFRGKNKKNIIVITCVTAVSIKQKLLEADRIIVHSLATLIYVISVQILKHIQNMNTYLHNETRRTII